MLIVGLGQYPNLGVTDAFALVRRGTAHRVVRASRELGADRMNTRVGPFGVEVVEGLKRLRVVLGPNEHGLSDLHATLLLPVHLMVGTGYGLEPDWRDRTTTLGRPEDAARMWGMVDAVGRFDYDGHTGSGLYEYWALGDHPAFR
jgi:hypothetical protein